MSRGTALITGASSGIGAELAKLCAAGGYDVVLVARRAALLEKLAADLVSRHDIDAPLAPPGPGTPGTSGTRSRRPVRHPSARACPRGRSPAAARRTPLATTGGPT